MAAHVRPNAEATAISTSCVTRRSRAAGSRCGGREGVPHARQRQDGKCAGDLNQ